MMRRLILRHPQTILLLAVVAIAMPNWAAQAQDRAMLDRLDRLERDLSMLQRQVFRVGSAPVGGAGSAAVDTELRMDRLEAQMRDLTGRIEDAVNGVEQLRRRLEQINSDIEVRFGQGQGAPRNPTTNSHASAGMADASPPDQLAMRGSAANVSSPRPRPTLDPMPPGTPVPPPPDRPGGAGTLTPPGVSASLRPGFQPGLSPSLPPGQPLSDGTNVAIAGTLRPPATGELPAGSASQQYNTAFGLLKQADYPAAEAALKTFVARHPKDPLAGSAQYWLGETYYARGRYGEAASAFAEGYKNYPKGAKAADDLLKLGMALGRTNQKQNACVAFAQLEHDFPHPGSAIKETATAEKKRLGC